MFGSPSTTSSSTFGSTTTSTGFTFGSGDTKPLFGASSSENKPAFNFTSPKPSGGFSFDAAKPAGSTPSLFGSPTSTSAFGASKPSFGGFQPPPNQTVGSPGFGQPVNQNAPQNLSFGGSSQPPAFGAATTQASAFGSPSSSLFGPQSSATTTASTGFAFGTPASGFSAQPTAAATTAAAPAFGKPAGGGFSFGGAATTAPAFGSATPSFGQTQPSQPTATSFASPAANAQQTGLSFGAATTSAGLTQPPAFGSTGGFSFAPSSTPQSAAAPPQPQPPAASAPQAALSFGTASAAPGGFSFASPPQQAAPAASAQPKPSFGSPSASAAPATATLSFGAPASSAPPAGLSFGTTSTPASTVVTTTRVLKGEEGESAAVKGEDKVPTNRQTMSSTATQPIEPTVVLSNADWDVIEMTVEEDGTVSNAHVLPPLDQPSGSHGDVISGSFGSPASAAASPGALGFGTSAATAAAPTAIKFGTPASAAPTSAGPGFGTAASTAASTGLSFGSATTPASTGLGFGTTTTTAASTGLSFGTTTATPASTGLSFGATTATTATPASTGLSFGATTATPASTGLSFGAPSATTTTPASTGLSFGAKTSAPATTGLGFGSTTSAAATTGLGFGATTFGKSVASTAASSTAAPTSATGISLLGKSTAATALSTLTTATTTSAAAAPPQPFSQISFAQLEENINKWTLELEEQEKTFINQATQINAWDRLLIANGEKIVELNDAVQAVQSEQQSLEHELDFVLAQQKELEDLLAPLEKQLLEDSGDRLRDPEREHMYSLAENLDTQLRQMSEDLKEVIEHLNETNRSQDSNDPIVQIGRILNAHMSHMQWVDTSIAHIAAKLDTLKHTHDTLRKDNERSFHLTYN